jgi:hypothetical protein
MATTLLTTLDVAKAYATAEARSTGGVTLSPAQELLLNSLIAAKSAQWCLLTGEEFADTASVPPDVSDAVAFWVACDFKSGQHPGIRSESVGGGQAYYSDDAIPPRVQAVIDAHKVWGF